MLARVIKRVQSLVHTLQDVDIWWPYVPETTTLPARAEDLLYVVLCPTGLATKRRGVQLTELPRWYGDLDEVARLVAVLTVVLAGVPHLSRFTITTDAALSALKEAREQLEPRPL